MPKNITKKAVTSIETRLASPDHIVAGGVITPTRDALLLSLHPGNDFFVDQEVSDKFGNIAQTLIQKEMDLKSEKAALDTEHASLTAEKIVLDADRVARLSALPVNAPERKSTSDRLTQIGMKLPQITGKLGIINPLIASTIARKGEYQALVSEISKFDIDRALPDMSITTNTYNIKTDLIKPGVPNPTGYNFYDEKGNAITLANYRIDIKLADGTTKDVQIHGLPVIPNPPALNHGEIDLTGISFTDRSGAIYVPDQAYEFTLHPGTIITLGGRNFIHSKPLKVLRSQAMPVGAVNTAALRTAALGVYNSSGPGNIVRDALNNFYDTNFTKLQDKSLEEALKHADGIAYAKLDTEEKKKALFDKIRSSVLTNPAFNRITEVNLKNYPLFNGWYIADPRDWNKDINIIKDSASYQFDIHNNISSRLESYITAILDDTLTKNITNNITLKAELTDFVNKEDRRILDKEKTKTDNTMHTDVRNDIDSLSDESKTKTSRRKIRGLSLGKKDVNYLRFFSGQSVSVPEQTVDLTPPVKYNLDVELSSKNSLITKIKIDGKKPLTLKGGATLEGIMKEVLENRNITPNKVRAHIAYNIMKAMIQMAKNNDINLDYYTSGNKTNRINLAENGNIVVEQIDDVTNAATFERITTTIFDYKNFEKSNNFDTDLRSGIDSSLRAFNCAMNRVHDNYKDATEKGWMTETDLPASIWTSPLKKILNKNKDLQFDFETNVSVPDGRNTKVKNVQIGFEKNKFTISCDALNKPISGSSLGKLLNTTHKGNRIFDGIERDIFAKVYQEMVGKLRTNPKIENSNFAVLDPVSQKIYVLDKDGSLGFITPEIADRDKPIESHGKGRMVTKGALAAALTTTGILTGGATAPISIAGAATYSSWSLAALSAIGLSVDIARNSKKNYGTITDSPHGLQMMDESESLELYKNPFLMGRLIKAMSERLGRF